MTNSTKSSNGVIITNNPCHRRERCQRFIVSNCFRRLPPLHLRPLLFKIAMWTMERHPGNHRLKSALLRLVSKKFGKAEIWEKLALVQVEGKFLPYAACKDWDKPVDPPIKKQVIWCCIVPMLYRTFRCRQYKEDLVATPFVSLIQFSALSIHQIMMHLFIFKG